MSTKGNRLTSSLALSDQELVAKSQGGDGEAIGLLFTRHRHLVFRVGLHITKNEADAEEVVQDTFLSVIRFIGAFDRRSTFTTWLYRIAANHSLMIIRHIKTASRHEAFSTDEADGMGRRKIERMIGAYQSPERIAATMETIEFIHEKLRFLSPKLRSAFIFHAIKGLTNSEIAELSNCSEGAVKARLFHARQQLQSRIPRERFV